MAKKTTHAIMVLDRSGSMEMCRDATIDGYNEQLNALKGADGKVSVTLLQFDSNAGPTIEVQYEKAKVSEAPKLTKETYVPRGGTPMLDAVGKAIAIGDADAKSDSILVMICSDGQENSSVEHTWASIAALIKDRQEKGNWTFAYIGANQDLSDISKRTNIPLGNTLAYAATDAGTRAAYTSRSASTIAFAGSAKVATEDFFNKEGGS